MKTIIRNANVITGYAEDKVLEDTCVLINEEGFIEYVGKDIPDRQGYKTIDLNGNYLMPGLIDAHVHMFMNGAPPKNMTKEMHPIISSIINSFVGYLVIKSRYKSNMKKLILSGVTTIRDVGSAYYMDVKYRDKVKEGKVIGPRILASGPIITITGGHGSEIPTTIEADGMDAFRKATRYNLSKTVDWIKICSTGGITDSKYEGEAGTPYMTQEEIRVVCEEAHRRNIMVATHCQSLQGTLDAIQAGVDSIEHGSELTDEMMELMINNPNTLRGYTSIVPTLSALYGFEIFKDKVLKYKDNIIPYNNAKQVRENAVNGLNKAINKGIKIGIGTDASLAYVTHRDTYKELIHMSNVTQLSNRQILEMATRGNAEFLGIGHITGSIEKNKSADLIAFKSNPLDDFNVLANPYMVMLKGKTIN